MDVSKLKVPEFSVNTRMDGDRAVVELAGELDEWTRPCVDEAIFHVGRQGAVQFTIDVTALSFVGVSGVHALVDLFANHPTSVVAVVGASPSYAKMLQVTGVADHLADLQLRP